MEREYAVVLEFDPEAGAYAALVPALPEIATSGVTVEEALANAREAIELALEVRTAEGEKIPLSDDVRHVKVAIPAA
ncbi:MAG: type II toxin-antitoxin system HicB family antitoxin [bacterium]|nr:type II toxin-antitoxin system HicB family antitoxin [bacterium]